jgi:putative peptidoglycan lipid II flippase
VKLNLTVDLMRLMLPTVVIFGISGLVMGILNAHQKFLVPALTPTMYSLGQIFGILVLAPSMGIYGLAWGVLIGAALHLGLQIPALLQIRGKYSPTLGRSFEPVREVGRLIGPRLFGVAIVQLNFWINTVLASSSIMLDGSINAVTYAFTIMLMPQAAIAQSIAIAAMPTLSAQFARGQLGEIRSSLAAALRGVLLLSIPASVGLIILRKPIVQLLFQRGEFTSYSTELVAWALLWFAAGLVAHSVVEILARAFYSLHDTKTPVIVGGAAMTLNILLSIGLSFLFSQVGWMPHGGLALANTIATALEMVGLLVLMSRRLEGLQGKSIWKSVFQGGAAAAGMGLALWAWLEYASDRPSWLIVFVGFAVGVIVYGTAITLQRPAEVRWIVDMFRRKLLKRQKSEVRSQTDDR